MPPPQPISFIKQINQIKNIAGKTGLPTELKTTQIVINNKVKNGKIKVARSFKYLGETISETSDKL